MKKHYRTDKNCLNCGATVTDKFCPNCGQENLELHENFLHLALHSVAHYFHFESKFFNSFVPLFTKPGYLTQAYFAGKRASHLNPISMYIFISILFFFLFTANTSINKKGILEENEVSQQEVAQTQNSIQKAVKNNKLPKEAAAAIYTIQPALDTAQAKHNDAVIYTNPAGKAEGNSKLMGVETDIAVANTLQAKFRKVLDDDLSGELFKNKLFGHLPKVMFILLPLFALILKLVYWRSSKYYVEHLIYSIHVHSFLFLFGSLLILLGWLLPSGVSEWLTLGGILVALWYIYRSLRNLYRRPRWQTVYKFCLLFFAYGFLFTLSTVLVFVATLYTV